MSGPLDGHLVAFGGPRALSAVSEAAKGDQELPERPPLAVARAKPVTPPLSASPVIVGASLTCTRCRRRFDAVFSDGQPSLSSSSSSLLFQGSDASTAGVRGGLLNDVRTSPRPALDHHAATTTSATAMTMTTTRDGLNAVESFVTGQSPHQSSSPSTRQLPIAEAVDIHRCRRDRVRPAPPPQQQQSSSSPMSSRTTNRIAADETVHSGIVASLQTAAGAYHPLQASLFSPWRCHASRAEAEEDCSPPSKAHLSMRATTTTDVDKALLPHLNPLLGTGFDWVSSPSARAAYLRRLWTAHLASLSEQSQKANGSDVSPDATIGWENSLLTLYSPSWRPHDLKTLSHIAQSSKLTFQPRPATRSTASGYLAPAQEDEEAALLEPLRWLPTPISADALTVSAVDFGETAVKAQERSPPDTASNTINDASHGVMATAFSPATLSRYQSQARTGSTAPQALRRPTEALHRELWETMASESGANLYAPLQPHSQSEAAVPLLAPLCPSCWENHGLSRLHTAAAKTYADAVDFATAAIQRGGETRFQASEGRSPDPVPPPPLQKGPLWRLAVASRLSPSTSADVTTVIARVVDAKPTTTTAAAAPVPVEVDAPVSRLNAELQRLRAQRVTLIQEAAALEAQLAALDRQVLSDVQPQWCAAVCAANTEQVRGFTQEGGDEARGRLEQIHRMAQSDCFLRHLSLLRVAFLLDVSGPLGRIAGLRLGTVVPYGGNTAPSTAATSATASTATPKREAHRDTTVVRRFLLPNADIDEQVRSWSAHSDELREAVTVESRQLILTQASLSGSETRVAPVETNTACGYLLHLLVHLAEVNHILFSRARLHPRGDCSVVDILKPLPCATVSSSSPAAQRGAATQSSGAGGRWFSWSRAASAASTPAPASGLNGVASAAAAAEREVLSTVDFHIKTNLLHWRTFGTGCVAVLGCIKELCEALSDALRAWRREQLTRPAPALSREGSTTLASPSTMTTTASASLWSAQPESPVFWSGSLLGSASARAVARHVPSSTTAATDFPHAAGDARDDLAVADSSPSRTELALTPHTPHGGTPTKGSVLLAHAHIAVTLDPPFAMGAEGTIDGFSVHHGNVSEAVWSLAMKKVLANVLWCVQATAELQRVRGS